MASNNLDNARFPVVIPNVPIVMTGTLDLASQKLSCLVAAAQAQGQIVVALKEGYPARAEAMRGCVDYWLKQYNELPR